MLESDSGHTSQGDIALCNIQFYFPAFVIVNQIDFVWIRKVLFILNIF